MGETAREAGDKRRVVFEVATEEGIVRGKG